MNEYFDFVPSTKGAFKFNPTLAGAAYVGYVRWNVFGQRWFLQLYDSSNALVFAGYMTGSGPLIGVQAAVWDAASATARLTVPAHGYPLGEIVELTVSNLGSAWDGTFEMLARTPDVLSYSLPIDPGDSLATGSVSFDNNLVEQYIENASIVFRTITSRIEVA